MAEADNPFEGYTPEIIPGERLVVRVIDSVARAMSVVRDAPPFMSNHYHGEHFENTGGGPALDAALDTPEVAVQD